MITVQTKDRVTSGKFAADLISQGHLAVQMEIAQSLEEIRGVRNAELFARFGLATGDALDSSSTAAEIRDEFRRFRKAEIKDLMWQAACLRATNDGHKSVGPLTAGASGISLLYAEFLGGFNAFRAGRFFLSASRIALAVLATVVVMQMVMAGGLIFLIQQIFSKG